MKKINTIETPFKEEIIRINEELKQLNLEKDKFYDQFFGGIKGIIFKNRNKIFKKKDLEEKYVLTNFFHQLKKDEEINKKFESYSYGNNLDKIDIATINDFYTLFEERLFAATYLVEMIVKYKNSNFQTNELCQKNNIESSFCFENILFNSTEKIFIYIENLEIKQLGKKMYNEYIKNKEITELESSIQDKTKSESSKKISLEQLNQYKDILDNASELLSNKNDNLINNNHQK